MIPTEYDICIVGAGPASLACISAIREPYSIDNLTDDQAIRAARSQKQRQPSRNKNKQLLHNKLRICIVDPNPHWLGRWKKNFRQLDIRHLRSPALAHPNMFDSRALLTYAYKKEHEAEKQLDGKEELLLYKTSCRDMKQLHGLGMETEVGLWDLPASSLFENFCDDLSNTLSHDFLHGYATDLNAGKRGNYDLEWVDAISGMHKFVSAQKVILAMGMVGKPIVPQGLMKCPTVQWNASNAFSSLPSTPMVPATNKKMSPMQENPKQHILVIGGGLTAIQTTLRVVDDGHTCKLCSRRPLQEKHFDIPIEWFDRRTTNACLSKFYHDTIESRLNQLKEARNGGSIPSMYLKRVEENSDRLQCWVGEVEYYEPNEEKKEEETPMDETNMIHIQFEKKLYTFDKVILATGISPNCSENAFYRNVLKRFPTSIHGGFPNVTQDMRWSERTNIFVTGAMAALQVGPDAGNLMGMRRAALAISSALGCRQWLRKTVLTNKFEQLVFDSDSESESDTESDTESY